MDEHNHCGTRRLTVTHLSQTASTNDWLLKRDTPDDTIEAVFADCQTAGRGQGGHTWLSREADNLLMSVGFVPRLAPGVPQYALLEAMALAVRDAIRACVARPQAVIKWPNDIYLDGHKVSGTLAEFRFRGSKMAKCVIGVGVNIRQHRFPDLPTRPASLCHFAAEPPSPEELLHRILDIFLPRLDEAESGSPHIHADYCAGQYPGPGLHTYRDNCGTFRAEVAGITTDGHLTLRTADGQMRAYAVGDVALGEL